MCDDCEVGCRGACEDRAERAPRYLHSRKPGVALVRHERPVRRWVR